MPSGNPTIQYDPTRHVYFVVSKPEITFSKRIGSKADVWNGNAYQTSGQLKKSDLTINKKGLIVSKCRSKQTKRKSNLHSKNISSRRKQTRKRFIFRQYDRIIKDCLLEQRICSYPSCNRITDYPIEYCPQHLQSEMHLCIQSTTLPGLTNENGLFACNGEPVHSHYTQNAIVFLKNQKICTYQGKKVTEEEKQQIIDTEYGPYLIELSNGTMLDSACLRGVGSFFNHKPRSLANARFYENHVYANKDIRNGQELFVSYGYHPVQAFTSKGYYNETKDIHV